MSPLRTNRIWQIAYPIVVYYLMYHCLNLLMAALFRGRLDPLWCLGIASAVTGVILYRIYRQLPVVKNTDRPDQKTICRILLAIAGIVALGILLNIIISNTGLAEISEGYKESNQTLFSGDTLTKILVNCMIIPATEEIVYRGIVCGQMDLWYGSKISVPVSALLFGIMHFNMVQFLYAFLMGLALGYVYSKYKKLWVPFAAHGLTNLVVVIATVL